MTENEKIELFDKWYDENYDEWAEGEEGIALREELEQAFKGGIADLEKENAELKETVIKMNKKERAEIFAFYDLYKKEKGEKMYYKFKCESCGKAQEVEIAIKDYDKEKDKQKCSCGGKLKRVIEWEGIATAEGSGWFGKSDGSKAI